MRHLLLSLPFLALTACLPEPKVEWAPPEAGDGVTKTGNTLSLDSSRVPIVAACEDGQVVRRKGTGWECATPSGGSGPVAWEAVQGVDATTIWPGKVAAANVTGVDLADLQAKLAALQPPTCTGSKALQWTGSAWDCVTLSTGGSSLATPPTCGAGKALQWTGSAWSCEAFPAPFDASPLTSRVSALEQRVPAGSNVAVSLEKIQTNVAANACVDFTHNLNTAALGYAAWMTDKPSGSAGAVWVPVTPGYEAGLTNLALNKASGASSVGNAKENANDGRPETQWDASLNPANQLGWWQVSLGASAVPIGTIRFRPINCNDTSSCIGTTSWQFRLSTDGTNFGAPIGQGSCVPGSTCTNFFTVALPSGTTAQIVRFEPQTITNIGGTTTNRGSLAELEVYGTQYTLSQPSTNLLRFCNYSGAARDVALRVWK